MRAHDTSPGTRHPIFNLNLLLVVKLFTVTNTDPHTFPPTLPQHWNHRLHRLIRPNVTASISAPLLRQPQNSPILIPKTFPFLSYSCLTSRKISIPDGGNRIMRLILTTLLLSALLCLFIDAAAIPAAEIQKRDTNEPDPSKQLDPRTKAARRRRPGHRKNKKEKGLPKYFHEPGGSELGNHYDSRFHHGIQDYADRKNTQLHMLRAYLTFFNENHLETWLAHGTLLGWWWNGKMLPWDWDIDTQVSGSTLSYLAEHYNGTQYNYISNEEPAVERSYLLDINPASVERERGNGLNIIDARWIDTRNGLYIDITGLSETHPDDQPGLWVCKNYHRYRTTDLYPMRETMYEGVVAKVPYAYDRILTQEYEAKALVLTDYEGHRWDPIVKEWLQKSEEELAEEKREKEEKEKEKKEQKKEEEEAEERKKKEEESRKKEEEEKKKAEEEKKQEEIRAKKQMEKEKADKQAEVKRLREQQQSMKGASVSTPHDQGPQEKKAEEQSQQPETAKVNPPSEPSGETSPAENPSDVHKQENKTHSEEGPLGPQHSQEKP
ncbi:MAG: hypothetical protein Q9181_006882 [Wetmoreana brouardii]